MQRIATDVVEVLGLAEIHNELSQAAAALDAVVAKNQMGEQLIAAVSDRLKYLGGLAVAGEAGDAEEQKPKRGRPRGSVKAAESTDAGAGSNGAPGADAGA